MALTLTSTSLGNIPENCYSVVVDSTESQFCARIVNNLVPRNRSKKVQVSDFAKIATNARFVPQICYPVVVDSSE